MQTVKRGSATWLVWLLCALVIALALLAFGLGLADLGGRPTSQGILNALSGLVAVPFALVAALIISRQPRNVIGWLMMVPAVMVALDPLVQRYLAALTEPPAVLTLPLAALLWYSGWSWLLLVFPVVLI